VYDEKLAQDVWAFQASRILGSQFEIGVTLRKGVDPQKVLGILDEEIAKVQKAAPTADEVERSKTNTLATLVFGLESLTTRANWINQYNQDAGDPAYIKKDVDRYQRTTPDDLKKVATTVLVKDARIVTIVTPTPGAPRAGRLVGGAK
jgi:predicted Zn-dependent peptidase